MLLRARVVVPVSQPPIENGAVAVRRSRVMAVGKWGVPPFRGRALDLGECILLPGLVNAHCHLDYTYMAGQFPPPKAFTDWLKLITSTKAGWTFSDFAESWIAGAAMLLRTGTTTVADVEAVPQLLPQVWSATPIRVLSFLELIGIGRRPSRELMEEVIERVRTLPGGRGRLGLSPHAPYSTVPDLLGLCARVASRRNLRIATHIGESALEYEMFARRRGEMFQWLRRSGRDMSDCGLGSPARHMERCGLLGESVLAVHANYLHEDDPALLASRNVSVAHCPRSHSYFAHRRFPLRRLTAAGVNVCLGTDSLASVRKSRCQTIELSMFEEMRAFSLAFPGMRSPAILRMSTMNGAKALGMAGKVGEISPGAYADLVAIPFSGAPAKADDAIVNHSGPVQVSLIGGSRVYPGRREL